MQYFSFFLFFIFLGSCFANNYAMPDPSSYIFVADITLIETFDGSPPKSATFRVDTVYTGSIQSGMTLSYNGVFGDFSYTGACVKCTPSPFALNQKHRLQIQASDISGNVIFYKLWLSYPIYPNDTRVSYQFLPIQIILGLLCLIFLFVLGKLYGAYRKRRNNIAKSV